MRIVTLLLMSLAMASAQTDLGKLLGEGMKEAAAAGFAPVPEADRTEIMKIVAEVLSKHLTFRPDGTTSAVCTPSGRQQVEWKKFVVSSIQAQQVTEADRLNGISKRCSVCFSCDAHRSWDSKKNAWGQWHPFGHVMFPGGIYVEWKGGKWGTIESDQLKYFSPGPGQSVIAPKPGGNAQGLPPGMTRG